MFEEIIAKLFTKMGKDTLTQNQEAQRVLEYFESLN